MNNEKYINNVTLEYLLNPVLYEKIINQKNISNNLLDDDILFYKRRITQLTKDMCNGNYDNNNLKTIFFTYASAIVYYLKQLDEKDILQSYYDDLDLDTSHNPCLSGIDISLSQIDNLIINKPYNVNNLDKFVKKINIPPEKPILPRQRVVNISDPALKKKGLKKKISS